MEKFTTMGGKNSSFPTTRWTRILQSQGEKSPTYEEDLNYLLSRYWKPVYTYICLSWNTNREEAKDITQDFFISLMERNSLEDLSPEKGKFRHFLKAALKNFMLNYRRDQNRIKRGGQANIFSIHFDEDNTFDLPDSKTQTPEEAYYQEWSKTVMDTALKRLGEELAEEDKEVYFQVFQKFYFSTQPKRPSHQELADAFDLGKFDVGNYLKATRKRFAQAIFDLIREYVADEKSAQEEFRELMGNLTYGS